MANLDQNLKESLNLACLNLVSMLNETEKLLTIEKEKYNQVKSVYVPWPVKKRKSVENVLSETSCTCVKSDIPTDTSIKESDSSIVKNIPTIVNKTKVLRLNVSKNNVTKFADAKKSIKDAISSKPDSLTSKTCIKSTKSSMSLTTLKSSFKHSPSCSFYTLESNKISRSLSYSNLSEAVNAYGIPSALQKILKDYHKFVLEPDYVDNITKKVRESFLRKFNQQNEEAWFEVTNKFKKLPKYMSAVSSTREKNNKNEMPCIIYKNFNDLILLETNKFEQHKEDMWMKILEIFIKHILPIINNIELSEVEKIYICKMIRTVCNFSICKVPIVPIYKL